MRTIFESAVKPENGGMEDWQGVSEKRRNAVINLPDGAYLALADIGLLALGKEGNVVSSPAAVFFALLLLSRMTGSETRQEILTACHTKEDKLRETCEFLIRSLTWNSNQGESRLRAGLWANECAQIEEELLQKLGKRYGMDSYAGRMESEEMKESISAWLDKATGGLLKNQLKITTSGEELLKLFSTLYFSANWEYEFEKEDTRKKIFTNKDGSKIKVPFMHCVEDASCYDGEHMMGVTRDLKGGFSVTFILPKDLTIDELIESAEFRNWLNGDDDVRPTGYNVNLSLPSFDLSARDDIRDVLSGMGIVRVFDAENADFSPISREGGLYLSKVEETIRFQVDETGVKAASSVEMEMMCLGMPPELEKISICFDRPFLFVLHAVDAVPMVVGKVESLS